MSGPLGTAKGFPDGYQPATGKLATILDNSAWDGFHEWGFVILRGVYSRDAEWDNFLQLYKAAMVDELHSFGLTDELGPHLQFTVIEDRAALESASKNAARARFSDWVAEQCCGELAGKPGVLNSHARFRYCLYVDEICLRTMTAQLCKFLGTGERWCLGAVGSIVIIHALHQNYEPEEPEEDEEEDDFDEYPPIEGNTNEDVGWAYIDVLGHAELYAQLSSGGSIGEVWYGMVYRGRRPDRDPEPKYSGVDRPLSAVPRGGPFGEYTQQFSGNEERGGAAM